MKNLEQIRAQAALVSATDLKREAISKLPGMIVNNGLLAAAAFCDAEGDGPNKVHLKRAMEASARHLQQRGIIGNGDSIQAMVADLCAKDSNTLQRATAETLAFLGFLKRFAPKGNP